MQKKIIKYLISYISILLFFSCAAINNPSGGSADKIPPLLLTDEIIPANNINIKKNQTIKLFFNERIHPNTTLGSITVEPKVDIIIRCSDNLISIKPKSEWPDQFKIFISRKITDYFNNSLALPIDLLFSRTDTIYNKQIKGTLFNIDTTKIYEVALLDTNGSIFSKTESNIKGEYTFSGLQNYSFDIIVSVENKISDNILFDIRNKRYGISNRNVNVDNNPIFISDPIYRSKINNITLVNKQYGKINLSNNTSLDVIFNNNDMKQIIGENKKYLYYDYDFKDSLFINMLTNNHIENYILNSSIMLSDDVLDTLPPIIDSHYIIEDSLLIKFSEPILANKNLDLFYYVDDDSNKVVVQHSYLNPRLLYLNNENEVININCNGITDLMFNPLCDSLLLISNIENNEDNISYGEINGNIVYDGDINLIIEAENLETKKIIRDRVIDNKFKFDNLIEGNYRIFVYEDINPIGGSYFSGTLEPVQRSANFSIYHKDIYVRKNWSNSILLQF